MNILYFFPELDSYMYKWQRVHIFDELEKNGHTINVFNPLNYRLIEDANEHLIHYIKNNKISFNLFMSCAGAEFLYRETIMKIKSLGLPTLLICFDNLHAPYMHKKIASCFDLVWLTSKETIGMFKEWGCNNLIFLPYAANPFKFYPTYSNEIYSIGFIGSPYGSRINKINNLLNNNVSCTIYSDSLFENISEKTKDKKLIPLKYSIQSLNLLRFKIGRKVLLGAFVNKLIRSNQYLLKDNDSLIIKHSIPFTEMNSLYSNHALSLNITELRNTYVLNNPIHKLHLRTFEIPMCGGLQISSYVEELTNYFDDGKEIVLYKTKEELISKSKFYLNVKNSTLRLKMKERARHRALSEHTWMNRFNIIFNKI